MDTANRKIRWGFFLTWALATLFGIVVGFAVFFIVMSALGESGALPANSSISNSLASLIFTCCFGTVIGLAQGSVLRRFGHKSGIWILATLLGFLVSAPVLLRQSGWFGPVITSIGILRMTAALGIVLGIVQWFILSKKVDRAVLWIGVSLISWVLAGLAGMGLMTLSWEWGPILYWLGMFFIGTLLTAVGMIWMFNHPIPPAA